MSEKDSGSNISLPLLARVLLHVDMTFIPSTLNFEIEEALFLRKSCLRKHGVLVSIKFSLCLLRSLNLTVSGNLSPSQFHSPMP